MGEDNSTHRTTRCSHSSHGPKDPASTQAKLDSHISPVTLNLRPACQGENLVKPLPFLTLVSSFPLSNKSLSGPRERLLQVQCRDDILVSYHRKLDIFFRLRKEPSCRSAESLTQPGRVVALSLFFCSENEPYANLATAVVVRGRDSCKCRHVEVFDVDHKYRCVCKLTRWSITKACCMLGRTYNIDS